MGSRSSSPLELDSITSQASATTSGTPLPDVLARMMAPIRPATSTLMRDRCKRLEPTYNNKYDPNRPPPGDISIKYSPYVYGEPLYDDRAIIVANLPQQHTVAGAAKRQRTSWVWNLGYALIANSKPNKPLMWACKLCMYKSGKS
jgi:hypothetical protein